MKLLQFKENTGIPSKNSKKYKTDYWKQSEQEFDFVAPCFTFAPNYLRKYHWKIYKLDLSCVASGMNNITYLK